jgi:hypothetical protein
VRVTYICNIRQVSFNLGYSVFAALMSWGIIALNQRVARRALQPRREDIVRLLAQMQL